MKGKVSILLGIVLVTHAAFLISGTKSTTLESFFDPRDGQSYPIVMLDDVYWFASNLNFATKDAECYEDENIACGEWGRLYPIHELGQACPDGWRVPNKKDWNILQNIIDKQGVFALYDGEKWHNNEDATNATGLSLVPSGLKHKKKFQLQYINSTIWFNDSTQEGSNWHFHTDGNNNEANYYFHTHEDEVYVRKFAIRCVCDRDKVKK